MTLKIAILQTIKGKALKSTDLAMRVVELMHPSSFSTDEFHRVIERMVAEKELIELEYILSERPNQVKSIYFPKDTLIVSGGYINDDSE